MNKQTLIKKYLHRQTQLRKEAYNCSIQGNDYRAQLLYAKAMEISNCLILLKELDKIE